MSHANLDNRNKNTGKWFVNLKERWDGHPKALDIQSRNGNHKTSDSTNDRMVFSHAGGHKFHAMIMDDHAWSKRMSNLVPKLPSCPRSHLAQRICDVEASVTRSTRQSNSPIAWKYSDINNRRRANNKHNKHTNRCSSASMTMRTNAYF
jgi:hypothetical protein